MAWTIERTPVAMGLSPGSIVMSFDDGPVGNGVTAALLDVLERHQVRSAFCVVGRRLAGHESLIRRVDAEGHLLVNHGFRHRAPYLMKPEGIVEEMVRGDAALACALDRPGWQSPCYRPPSGFWSPRLARIVHESGKQLMPISFFAWDSFWFPGRMEAILKGLTWSMRRHGGGVFMLHEAVVPLTGESDPPQPRDQRRWVSLLVDRFIALAKAEGYQFVDPAQAAVPAEA